MSENEEGVAGGSDSEGGWEGDHEEDGLPSYEFRFECAKMLLELEDTTETAIQVGPGAMGKGFDEVWIARLIWTDGCSAGMLCPTALLWHVDKVAGWACRGGRKWPATSLRQSLCALLCPYLWSIC
jgi:hypothetical protein